MAAGSTANDTDTVQWFTRIILQQTCTTTPSQKKSRTLNALHAQWTALLAHMEDLTHRHLRTETQTNQSTCLRAHTVKHLRELRAHYNKALGAKQDYFKLLSTQLQNGIRIAQLHRHLRHHVSVAPEAYTAAKLATRSLYMGSATWVALNDRHRAHVRRSQDMTHTHHHYIQLLYNHAVEWFSRQQLEQHAYMTMHIIYNAATHLMRQQLYLYWKRPREEWDPSVWEIPLRPLPKRQKKHWDLVKWEIHLS